MANNQFKFQPGYDVLILPRFGGTKTKSAMKGGLLFTQSDRQAA
jgi:hypothetical protein